MEVCSCHLFVSCVVLCSVAQSCQILGCPMDCRPPGSSVHGDSPGKNSEVDCHAILQVIFPTRGSNSGFLHCRRILLLFKPPRKPMTTGVGSLSFLQGIFWIQESTRGLLHCRQILYQLSHKGSLVQKVKHLPKDES